jgi:steroid delta-isomerase-like uncharacterized protein
MSTEQDPEVLMRQWFEEIWNKKQPELIPEMLGADAVAHGMGPNGTDLYGPEAFTQAYHVFVGAFPDLHITVEQAIKTADRVALLLTCEGTHAGDHLGVPGTGKRVKFSVMTMGRYQDGKIVEGWNVIDLLSALRQSGSLSAGDALP